MPKKIEDYALIGDCESAVLVGRNGSMDWLCWPRFDSGALFAALLGDEENGYWRLSPEHPAASVDRHYLGNTLSLETIFTTDDGAQVGVVDFMPLRADGHSHVVRLVRGRRGRVAMTCDLVLRFDYGSIVPWVTRLDSGVLRAIAGPDKVLFRSDVPMVPDGFAHRGKFVVGQGETVCFVLSYGSSFEADPPAVDAERALEMTNAAWEHWIRQSRFTGKYASEVNRSLITLKALTYRATGGIVAAPTTSLPEAIGGERNWDYRFCWLRDATFTLLALLNSGFEQEASEWRTWLRHAVAGHPAQVQIMYGIAGERRLDEWEIPWLSGYSSSKPVRIGNAAAKQRQLDIFGEVMDALFQAQAAGLSCEITDWDLQTKLIEHLETIWRNPDEGVWEVRGGQRHFTHSKVMAWVAFDRAVKSVEKFGVEGPVERWRQIRSQIHAQVCELGYNERVGSFVQSYGSSEPDASALLIPIVGFLPPDDHRVRSTVDRIGRELRNGDLIRRYDQHRVADGLRGGEGAFLACSFWFADNLVLLGRTDEARDMFEHLLSLRNDVGLLAEEYDPVQQRMVGNFPQAFSHIGLINTAHNLSKAAKPVEQRSSRTAGLDTEAAHPLSAKPG